MSRRTLFWLLAALLLAALHWPTWSWFAERFNAHDSFYQHGWVVPLASLWLAWERRGALAKAAGRPDPAGLALLIPAVAAHGLAAWLRIGVVSGFSLVATLTGLVWAFEGRAALRVLWLPLAFLLFMVPLPGVVLIGISFQMKLWAAALAAKIVSLAGVPAQLNGSMIRVPGVNIIVDDTCSGLRSLISLAALAVLWAALLPPRTAGWIRAVVVAAAAPIALLTNMVRILVLIFVAVVYGARAAEGFVHLWAGLVVYGLAIALLAGLSRGLLR